MPESGKSVTKRNGFQIYYYNDGYKKKVSLHHHNGYEIYFCTAGKVNYLIEGKQFQISEGTCMMIPPGTLHEPVFQSESAICKKYERYILHINKSYFKWLDSPELKFIEKFTCRLVPISKESLPFLTQLFSMLKQQENSSGYGAAEWKRACIQQILILIERSFLKDTAEALTEIPDSNPVMNTILNYIGIHLTENLSADTLSEKFSLNKFYFLREFKKYVGTTPYHYILKKRLILAEDYLLKGNSVKDTYLRCGFSDYSNFFRSFKNEYGKTPKQFYDEKFLQK